MSKSQASIIFNYAEIKSGRGAAVRRTFEWARSIHPEISFYVEADSDGSHRPADIIRILRTESNADLVIGSRYSRGSKISGWPLGRRVFSKMLNLTIPRILLVPSADLTNGLRRYSSKATNLLLENPPQNPGFIYLSECAYLISKNNLSIEDLPIHFENRLHGESTVGRREIFNSLNGLFKLIVLRLNDVSGF